MFETLRLAADNLTSPPLLFFLLGVGAACGRSDLAIPEAVGKALSLYLMLAIGYRGGVELSATGITATVATTLVMAMALSFLIPVASFLLLRVLTRLDPCNAAAVAAHYGSVSIVTFVAAVGYLDGQAIAYEGHVVAMLALMETPAIVSGLLLARWWGPADLPEHPGAPGRRDVAREVLLSGGVVLVGGSFLIGLATGEEGMGLLSPVVEEPFTGVLAIFLLDMGLLVGRRLRDFRAVGWAVVAFGLYMPPLGAAAGLTGAYLLGMSEGGLTLGSVLAASASYIVVPAAMRVSLPQANPTIYVTLSLAVTFPFNLIVGIPLYHAVAQWVTRL